MQRRLSRIPLVLVLALCANLLFPAAYGTGGNRAAASAVDPYWTVSEKVDRSTAGVRVYPTANAPAITPDGRYVAFEAGNPSMDPRLSDSQFYTTHIYLYDRLTGKTELIDAVGPSGEDVANNASYAPSISDDGSRVAFHSMATNLTDREEIASVEPGSVDNFDRVYVYDRNARTMTLASVNAVGDSADYFSQHAKISGDGSTVVFESEAGNLAGSADEYMYNWQIYAHDLTTNETTLISDPEAGMAGQPAVNADGSFIAYVNAAYDYDAQRYDADVYRYRKSSGLREKLTSVSGHSEAGNYGYRNPAISADGGRVVFESAEDGLLPDDDDNGKSDIVLYDDGVLSLISAAEDGTQGDDNSYTPDISPNGRYVGFVSDAKNLRPGLQFDAYYRQLSVYWYDIAEGKLTNLGGLEHAAYGQRPSLSDGGFAYTDGTSVDVAVRDASELPSWPDRAQLAVSAQTDGSVQLQWPAAVSGNGGNDGDGSIRGYKVFELRPDPVLGSYYSLDTLIGFTTDTTYRVEHPPEDKEGLSYRVEAIGGDYGSNRAGLAAPFASSEDEAPPSWGDGAQLEIRALSDASVTLAWPEASDNAAVRGYKLYRHDPDAEPNAYALVAEPAETSAKDEGLRPDSSYSYYVTAVDLQGNESEPLPALTVRTLSAADPQGGELTAEALPGGDVRLSWSAGDGVERYEVWDVTEAASPVKKAETGAEGETEYTVSGLTPSAAYKFQVYGYDENDRLVYQTLAVPVTAPAVGLTGVSVSRTGVFGGVAPIGSAQTITVNGQPGRTAVVTATYTTWYAEDGHTRLDTPRETAAAIPMSETAAGVYTGTFAFEEGVDRLLKVEAKLAASGGQESQAVMAPGLPLANSAGLRAAIEATGNLKGYKLTVVGAALTTSQTKTIDEDGDSAVVLFDRLKSGEGARLRVLNPSGKLVQEVTGIELAAGTIGERSVDLLLSKRLAVTVVDELGRPVPNQLVSLTGDQGEYLSAYTNEDGMLPATEWSPATASVRAELNQLPLAYEPVASEEIGLSGSAVAKEIRLQLRAQSAVSGTVRSWDGKPFANAAVEVSQPVGGQGFSKIAYTDAQGHYSLQAFAGPATVAFSGAGAYRSAVTATLSASGSVLDRTLEKSLLQTVKINLYTKYANGPWQGPLPIDWTTGIHLNIRVNGQQVTSDTVEVEAKPGTTVRVEADGSQGRLGSDVQDAVLEPDGYTEVDLRLDQQSQNLSAELTPDARWDGYSIDYWDAKLSKRGESGSWTFVSSAYGYGSQVNLGVPGDGHYLLSVRTSQGNANREFDSDGTQEIALGELTLHQGETRFEGQSGNGLAAYPSELAPGQIAKLRMVYEAAEEAADAKFLLDVPAGTELLPGTVTLNGAQADYTAEGTKIVVNAGTLAKGSTGTLIYQLKMLDSAAPRLPVSGQIRYKSGAAGTTGAAETIETIGAVTLVGMALSLAAPTVTDKLQWQLSGEGPAGATVKLLASGVPIGQAVVSAGGYWKLDANVPDPHGPKVYDVYAESERNGASIRSKSADVRYSPDEPLLKQLTIEQADGRRVTLDVSGGPVRFPYVVVPNSSFRFEAVFSHPEKVENVKVVIETANGPVAAPAELLDGVFYASMPPVWSMSESVYVTFDRKPDDGPKTIGSMEDLTAELPPAMRDYQVGSRQEFEETSSGVLKGSVDLTLPQVRDMGLHVDLELARDSGYTPTAEDLRTAEELGIEAYGVQYVTERDGDRMGVTITAYVPEDQIGSFGQSIAALATGKKAKASGGVKEVRAANFVSSLVKVTAKALWNEHSVAGQAGKGAASIYDTKSAVDGRGQVADTMKDLGDLADRIAECNPGTASYYGQRIESMATTALSVEAAKWGMMVAGALLAPATFGGSLALMGASMAIGSALDAAVGHQMDQLKDAVNKSASASGKCDPKPEAGHVDTIHLGSPAALPVWIYDPSGYVYETFPDNRIEGAKATVYQWDDAAGKYVPWDAEWYGQANPQTTDALGKYGWDVPNGKWQVVYEKEGYETARSAELPVPPPQFDVNVPMVSYAAPHVTGAAAETSASGTTVAFTTDKYVAADTLTGDGVRVTRDGGAEMAGTVAAVDPRAGDGGVRLARTFRFTSAEAAAVGDTLKLSVRGADAVSYAGTSMEDDFAADVPVRAKDVAAPALVSAIADASGRSIALRFGEQLDTGRPLARTDYSLSGTPLAISSVSYGVGGDTVVLGLGGALPAGVRPQVQIAADRLFDLSGNGFAGGTASVDSQVASSDASLAGLEVAGYSLYPSFQTNVTSYEIYLPEGMNTLQVKASSRDSQASVRVNGRPVGADAIAADVADEAVIVAVTAKDGRTTRYYELKVVRGSAPAGPGGPGGPTGPASPEDTGDDDGDKPDAPQEDGHEAAPVPVLTDLRGHWAESAIAKAIGLGLVNGYPDRTFKPNAPVTRAEFAAMLARALKPDAAGLDAKKTIASFADAADIPDWAAEHVAALFEAGTITGDERGRFLPNRPITRAEIVAMVAKALKLAPPEAAATSFADDALIPAWAKASVGSAVREGLIRGRDGNRFVPAGQATRAEAATILVSLTDWLNRTE